MKWDEFEGGLGMKGQEREYLRFLKKIAVIILQLARNY